MRKLTRDDLSDILHGATIMGAGGGGDLAEGFQMIDHAISKGKTFTLATVDEVPDDALVCTPYLLGAISELSAEEELLYQGLPKGNDYPILQAYDRLQNFLGQKFQATVACELGGSNTAVAFFAAAMNDAFILDADPAGRAVPEITHSTYYLNNLPASPIIAANQFGESFVFENVMDDQRAETLVRALSTVSRHDIAAIDHALPMSRLRKAIVPGTISLAQKLGQELRIAKTEKRDTAEDVAAKGDGKVLFRGRIKKRAHETRDGFTFGSFEIAGEGTFAGDTFRIDLKNENMAGYINNKVAVTIPELICLFDTDTGDPVSNPDYQLGQNVAVVVLPAPAPFTTDKGLAIFGPSYAGIDAPYRPVCQTG